MSNKSFSEEEMEQLRASPYVQKVSPSLVFFSAEFKEKLWKYLMEGKTPREAVEALGIDPKILGETRIAGLKTIVRKAPRTQRSVFLNSSLHIKIRRSNF